MRNLHLGLALATVLSACDSSSPDDGPLRYSATVDGVEWVPDTILALVFAAPADSSVTVDAARRVSPTESEEITVFLKHWGTGQSTLGDTSAPGEGAFSVTQIDGDSAVGFVIYHTNSALPGQVTITGLNRGDSVMTGRASFEAATIPDTLPHRHVSVTFRVRYTLQQVFVPEGATPHSPRGSGMHQSKTP
jgi:hypothetical protein